MDNPSIVIIGAGISGLAAADQLINTHKITNVTILEGQDRLGGRIHPVQFESQGFIQLGAEWLHNRHNPLFQMAVKHGLVSSATVKPDDFEKIRFVDQNGQDIPDVLKHDYLAYVDEKFQELVEKESFTGYDSRSYGHLMDDLLQRLLDKKDETYSAKDVHILRAMHRAGRAALEQYYSTSDWYQISLSEYTEDPEDESIAYSDGDDEEDISIHMNQIGYKAILDELIKRVPPEKYTRFDSHVRSIRWNTGQNIVQLELADGQSIHADHVIVTCSLGHLKKYAKTMFDPPLPQKKMATVEAFGYETVDKLMLIFDEPFWSSDDHVIMLLRTDHDSPEDPDISRMFEVIFISQSHPNVLTVWISGANATAFEQFPNDTVAETAAKTLRRYFKNPHIPVPKIMRSSWHSNPYFHGSYSYNSVKADQDGCRRLDLAEPLATLRNGEEVPVVLFAGEATNPTQYATTHGAYATGIREADRLAAYLKRS